MAQYVNDKLPETVNLLLIGEYGLFLFERNYIIGGRWGVFMQYQDFEDQYTGTDSFEGKIHYAGDIYCDSQIVSRKSCGVDCSGFVSRCWNLPIKQST